jgi:methionyl-tRNA formyltransferase
MKKTFEPIVFFGNERLATGFTTNAPTLTGLLRADYTIAAVITNYEAGKSRSIRELEVASIAEAHNIPLIVNEKPGDIIEQLRSYNATVGVLVAYGQIVPQRVIDVFPRGIINIHPSLLPLHRGPTPIESSILNGELKTGVSLMQLTKTMDAGPVYAQREITLNGTETKPALTKQLLEVGSAMLLEKLPIILSGSLLPIAQDDTAATYDQRISKEDGRIIWEKSAQQLEREVRAFIEWPKSRVTFGDLQLVITKAHVLDTSGIPGTTAIINKQPVVYCGKQALAIDLLKPASKKEMTGEAFLAGYSRYFT